MRAKIVGKATETDAGEEVNGKACVARIHSREDPSVRVRVRWVGEALVQSLQVMVNRREGEGREEIKGKCVLCEEKEVRSRKYIESSSLKFVQHATYLEAEELAELLEENLNEDTTR